MTIYDITKKLIGSISPYGDTDIDGKRIVNLNEQIELVFGLVSDLMTVAHFKDRDEASIKEMGQSAYDALLEIKDSIENNVDED